MKAAPGGRRRPRQPGERRGRAAAGSGRCGRGLAQAVALLRAGAAPGAGRTAGEERQCH